MKVQTKPAIVSRCVARQDGSFMIVTMDGRPAVASEPIEEGVQIAIRDGRAQRLNPNIGGVQ